MRVKFVGSETLAWPERLPNTAVLTPKSDQPAQHNNPYYTNGHQLRKNVRFKTQNTASSLWKNLLSRYRLIIGDTLRPAGGRSRGKPGRDIATKPPSLEKRREDYGTGRRCEIYPRDSRLNVILKWILRDGMTRF